MNALTAVVLATLAVVGKPTTRADMLAAFEVGDYALADRHAATLLEDRPNYPPLIYNRATFAVLQDDAVAAQTWLDALVAHGASYTFAAPGFDDAKRRLAALVEPHSVGEQAFTLPQPDFVPEGIAFDSERDRFFVGSVRHRLIVSIEASGEQASFVAAGTEGLGSIFGMRADPARNLLWVASATTPQMRPKSDVQQTGVWAFRLDDGRFVGRYLLDVAAGAMLGDLVVTAGGNILVSESRFGGVYELDPEAARYETVIEPGRLRSAQGLALSSDERLLFVADYSNGLHVLDRVDGSVHRLQLPAAGHDYGIDGLYRHGAALIGIQNLFAPHRVARFSLSDDGLSITGVEVLEAALSDYSEPTLGVIAGESLYYVANSQWNRFDEHDDLPAAGLVNPIIRALPLTRRR